ncbi:PQQ-dependent catabolism-associated beta-propeller protein [Lichenifustis flavocetrariae]|uniref:PQQ-dependent catabolism-associated beta-propeller protein n=1 Tax=Lichenifustis flavocetrariae TaxID=2949735 RepID=A0AA41YXA3_9HYPH|nr:PQQ-dependent catabolism-associated beta-propeller protein [Lichenifustis flavocetrariae]MCW6506638.1 PQQ-dependent catabolism-associated beta-propeller protein [Lichenifustis flavocetrariae]
MRNDRPAFPLAVGWIVRLAATGVLLLGAVNAAGAKDTGLKFVSNERSSEIFILDANDNAAGSFKSCGRPRGMKFTPDHMRFIVACGGDNTIAIYDVGSHKLVKRFRDVPDPEAFDLHPNGHDLYISNEDDAEATVINIETGEVTGHFPVGEEPEGVLATPDGKYVFVASEAANLVQVIDVATQKVVKEILTATRPRRLALTPDGKTVWVSDEIAGILETIDVGTLAVTGSVTFEVPGLQKDQITPVDIAITRDGRKAYVALGRADRVAVVDVATRKPIDYILVGKRPWGLRLTKDDKKLYVANGLSDDVAIIDTEKGRLTKAVPVGVIPYAILVDD